jgi:hypothetical protein
MAVKWPQLNWCVAVDAATSSCVITIIINAKSGLVFNYRESVNFCMHFRHFWNDISEKWSHVHANEVVSGELTL